MSVCLQLKADHLTGFGKFWKEISKGSADRRKGTVHKNQRLASAVNFVIHLESIHGNITIFDNCIFHFYSRLKVSSNEIQAPVIRLHEMSARIFHLTRFDQSEAKLATDRIGSRVIYPWKCVHKLMPMIGTSLVNHQLSCAGRDTTN